VNSVLQPRNSEGQTPKPNVSPESIKLEPVKDRVWDYVPQNPITLLGNTVVRLASLPNGYSSEELLVRLPLGRNKPLEVSIYGVKPKNNAQRVVEIYSTKVTGGDLSSDDLFRLYQELAVLSKQRLDEIQSMPRGIYSLDAKVFFKFLEVARELGRGNFIGISESVGQVQDYLRDQNNSEEGRSAITEGLGSNGTTMVGQLIQQIDFVEVDQLILVWDYLKTTPPSFSDESCAIYFAFVKTFNDIDDRVVERLNNTPGYKVVTLAYEATSTCATVAKEKAQRSNTPAIGVGVAFDELVKEAANKPFTGARIKKAISNIEGSSSFMQNIQ
jgi:hypothetical protein